MSARRSRVASSNTVGKMPKSSGRAILTTAMTTSTDSAMLNVNSTSSASGGSGNTTIASTASSISGAPTPRCSSFSTPSHAGAVAAVLLIAISAMFPEGAILVPPCGDKFPAPKTLN